MVDHAFNLSGEGNRMIWVQCLFNILITMMATGAFVLALLAYLQVHTHQDGFNQMKPNDGGFSGSSTQIPKQTGFYVTFLNWEYQVQALDVLKWDDIRYDPGQNFNITTGAYVAPSDGFYGFNIAISDNTRAGFFIQIDGKRANFMINPQSRVGGGSTLATMGVNVNLKAGQHVQVQKHGTGTVYGKYVNAWGNGVMVNSYFSGAMIY